MRLSLLVPLFPIEAARILVNPEQKIASALNQIARDRRSILVRYVVIGPSLETDGPVVSQEETPRLSSCPLYVGLAYLEGVERKGRWQTQAFISWCGRMEGMFTMIVSDSVISTC